MDVTRRTRPLLAGVRRGLAGALTAMLLVLAVVSAGAVVSTYHDATTVEVAVGPIHDGLRDCSDHHSPSAHCDPVVPVFSSGPAAAPVPSTGWLVSAVGHGDTPVPANTADASAPSLHALGISRT
ncbi:hypothetical protein ACQEVI_25755 [Promicromonospora sp. CA-289599]|uniref:hypothetical protein n=1 Tax=Promicromonospora sp. CA-289599 TaxID=3240014 RepID=UPI003D92892B